MLWYFFRHKVGALATVRSKYSNLDGQVVQIIEGMKWINFTDQHGTTVEGWHYLVQFIDRPYDHSHYYTEPRQLSGKVVPLEDGNKKVSWKDCAWQPRKWTSRRR